MMDNQTTSHLESSPSTEPPAFEGQIPTWIKLGVIAAASALAGGLAAAWFYRNTLNKLRLAESDSNDSDFWIQKDEVDSDS
jgi:hypothetical protein